MTAIVGDSAENLPRGVDRCPDVELINGHGSLRQLVGKRFAKNGQRLEIGVPIIQQRKERFILARKSRGVLAQLQIQTLQQGLHRGEPDYALGGAAGIGGSGSSLQHQPGKWRGTGGGESSELELHGLTPLAQEMIMMLSICRSQGSGERDGAYHH